MHETDVVVVGGGGAALRAALEARQAGARVLLLTKGKLVATGATAFRVASLAGYAVADGAGDPLDNPSVHAADILHHGAGCADPELVRILTEEAAASARALEQWGVSFINGADGKVLVAMGDFASRPRNRKIFDHGRPIAAALKQQCDAAGVIAMENTVVLDLLADKGRCTGVLAADLDGALHAVSAGSTVLATGGAGQLFEYSLMPPDVTGDGYALGYRAGAELANIEFVQAGFGLVHPFSNIIMAWFWLLGPRFTNARGEEFLDRYLPPGVDRETCFLAKVKHYPFSTEDPSRYLEIAALEELRAGRGTERNALLLDLRGVIEAERIPPGSDIASMWPVSKEWFRSKGVDVMARPLEVSLFGHAINGGLCIDAHGRTTVPGLYAAGEASAGPYGADRLGGNMLLNCQVFGARAGQHAARTAGDRRGQVQGGRVRDFRAAIGKLLGRPGGRKPAEVKREIQKAMSTHALIVRSGQGLEECLRQLDKVRQALPEIAVSTARELIDYHEAVNLLDVGELMARAALLRTESRGSHFRTDYPQRDPALACPIVIRQEAG
ncbi:MAG: FAD-binding protein, partial [Candidatus Methylomirabilota bacterium]